MFCCSSSASAGATLDIPPSRKSNSSSYCQTELTDFSGGTMFHSMMLGKVSVVLLISVSMLITLIYVISIFS